MSLQPVALFALEVRAGEIVPVHDGDLPAHIQITMAAIDPTSEPANKDGPKFSTLRIVRQAMDGFDGDSDSEGDSEEESDEESEEEEKKSAKGKKAAAKAPKKKAEKMDVDSEEEEDEEEDEDDGSIESFVVCTLDTEKNYQQPLNLTIQEGEAVFLQVSGNYTVYVTGNYVVPEHENDDENSGSEDDSEDEDYDLSPSEDELYEDDSEDELDNIADPRITEVTSEDEKPADKKGKKRSADEAEVEAKKEEPKLSKKQQKKLKANDGKAAEAPAKPETPKKNEKTEGKGDTPSKKVKFAKELEQGPTPSKNDPSSKKADKKEDKKAEKKAEKKEEKKPAGPRKIGNLTIEDKKIGEGAVAKNGNKVKVRYIGKLTNGKQFDACVKGKPFQFTLGKGEVIKGWDVGIAGMAPGGERRLTVPPEMGYGNKAAGSIPKNSTLIFDVKCIGIN